jgi:hypothetical protein
MIDAGILRFSFIPASKRPDFLDGAVCLAGRGAVAPPSFSHASTLGSEERPPLFVEVLIVLFLWHLASGCPLGHSLNE